MRLVYVQIAGHFIINKYNVCFYCYKITSRSIKCIYSLRNLPTFIVVNYYLFYHSQNIMFPLAHVGNCEKVGNLTNAD